uniref:Uncharacterized protein n=1 Tax=Salarias fasciatus TaxID=181472 RepID=A0A672FHX4_SALFA
TLTNVKSFLRGLKTDWSNRGRGNKKTSQKPCYGKTSSFIIVCLVRDPPTQQPLFNSRVELRTRERLPQEPRKPAWLHSRRKPSSYLLSLSKTAPRQPHSDFNLIFLSNLCVLASNTGALIKTQSS